MNCISEEEKNLFIRIELMNPGLPVLHVATVLPLLTHNRLLSAMNRGDGDGCQCIQFGHHGSFWLHIFLQI
jgi:hypothetical protein